jgi:hypothetical protein
LIGSLWGVKLEIVNVDAIGRIEASWAIGVGHVERYDRCLRDMALSIEDNFCRV